MQSHTPRRRWCSRVGMATLPGRYWGDRGEIGAPPGSREGKVAAVTGIVELGPSRLEPLSFPQSASLFARASPSSWRRTSSTGRRVGRPGRLTGLVGPNCREATRLACFAGEVAPDNGTVTAAPRHASDCSAGAGTTRDETVHDLLSRRAGVTAARPVSTRRRCLAASMRVPATHTRSRSNDGWRSRTDSRPDRRVCMRGLAERLLGSRRRRCRRRGGA